MQESVVVRPSIEEILWTEKYRYNTEQSIRETLDRTVEGVFAKDERKNTFIPLGKRIVGQNNWFIPGGRTIAGAGTDKNVTLINCYVNGDLEDSLRDTEDGPGIMQCLSFAAYTMQMGGGIGTNFSTLRPRGAIVKRTRSVTSGVVPFMKMWDAMCDTIMSGGNRRGAMMATLRIDHPDVIEFFQAKHKKDVLTNFNISVLVTDDFMDAVKNDREWDLGFHVPPANSKIVDRYMKNGKEWYVYKRMKAKKLWDMILKSTYEYAEPGVLFIDRINQMNNLWYCEDIECTNPCGEQPLPKHGACNLGSINLSRLVVNPFGPLSYIDWVGLSETVRFAMRFLDNVLDVTEYPLKEQAEESYQKRRTGLGFMGLGNMLQMLGVRYGSDESIHIAERVMEHIRNIAYETSVELSIERGPFPAFNRDNYLQGEFIKRLPKTIQDMIFQNGIRNSVLLTLAPTGNTSVFMGNVSSSAEPTFAWEFIRTMLRGNGEDGEDIKEDYHIQDYGYKKWREIYGEKYDNHEIEWPGYMNTATEISVTDHIRMQAALQYFVDSSISKTINCPSDMTFDDFKHAYDLAFELNCKGCTTYRPSEVRGAVLKKTDEICTVCNKGKMIKNGGCKICSVCQNQYCGI